MYRHIVRTFPLLFAALALAACSGSDNSNNGSNGPGSGSKDTGFVVEDTVDETDDATSSSETGSTMPDDEDVQSGGTDVDPEDDGGTSDAGPTSSDTGPDGSSGDAGPGCDPDKDFDADGLNNCEEKRLGTDPRDGDTDGDGLSDFEELQKQTDPTKADTDNDGANDREELRHGLDPNDPDTYDDNVLDGNRWLLEACEEPKAERVEFYKGASGNWTIALRPSIGNYRDSDSNTSKRGNGLTINGVSPPVAAAVYGDPANEVAGFLLSKNPESNLPTPARALSDRVKDQKLAQVGTVGQDRTGGNFDTHSGHRAASGTYTLQVPQSISTRKIRDELLFALAEGSFTRSDVKGLPSASGAAYRNFQVSLSVIYRKDSSGKTIQSLLSVGVAPASKYDNRDKTKSQLDDLTNTTNVSEQIDTHLPQCATFKPGKEVPKAEFYWVLDQSGSMNDYNTQVKQFSGQFEQRVRNTALRYRLGVTNMDEGNKGRLDSNAAWHQSSSTFAREVENRVIDCEESGSSTAGRWECSGGDEYGLRAARSGIKYMGGLTSTQPKSFEAFRDKAQVVTVFMSDERPNSMKDKFDLFTGESFNGYQDAPYQNYLQGFLDVFKGRTTIFSIVTDGNKCGDNNARSYREVALATQGQSASLCSGDLEKTIRDIIFAATGLASNYVLPQNPISSSLRVYLNGTWVPRSRTEGFAYFAERNSIAFFGDEFIPRSAQWECIQKYDDKSKCDCNAATNSNCKIGEFAGDFMAVHYETYKDRCKETQDDCQPRDFQ